MHLHAHAADRFSRPGLPDPVTGRPSRRDHGRGPAASGARRHAAARPGEQRDARCCPRFRAALGSPLLLEEVLNRHPKLRLYLMHAGYPYLDETIALMSVYPQVYADLSVIDWIIPRDEFHRYLQGLVRAGFGRRLMFGSDPMIWPEAIGRAIEGVDSAPFLSAAEKRDIFCGNAATFLRLDPSPC